MRFLFVAQGPSHVQWQIPLAWAAQLGGHEVLVATRPTCVDQVTRAGLPAVAIGDEQRIAALTEQVKADLFAQVGRRVAEQGGGDFAPTESEMLIAGGRKMIALAEGMAQDAVEVARAWRPSLVVHDTGALVGLVAAAVLGVPAYGQIWGATSDGIFDVADEHILPYFAPLFEKYGAEPLTAAPTWIDPSPPSLRSPLPVRRVDVRYTPYSGPGVVPEWLWQERSGPRVCLTTGISVSGDSSIWSDTLQRTLLDALRERGCEAVVTVKDASHPSLRALPPGVRLVENFPLNVLLPTCDAVIHHGGTGTGTTALALGVPQLVLAHHPMHRQWGAQIERSGAGAMVRTDVAVDPGAVTAAVAAVVEGAHAREKAAAVAAEIAAMPSPATVVEQLAGEAAAYSTGAPS
ncbi:nucleotide disphospho-sugar-binding domain-containing protein [Kitasatospora sp. NPDC101157]|uniref:nucleotide disphospho-sugar-binding domain-containing protein n=1 Tax=Kitasatospora sp. NPDC101157 TaxID=3364098 RepID=UPI0038022F9A